MPTNLVANDIIRLTTSAVANTQIELTVPDRAYSLRIRPTTNQLRVAVDGGTEGSTTVIADFHLVQANTIEKFPLNGVNRLWIQTQVANTIVEILCEMDRNP